MGSSPSKRIFVEDHLKIKEMTPYEQHIHDKHLNLYVQIPNNDQPIQEPVNVRRSSHLKNACR